MYARMTIAAPAAPPSRLDVVVPLLLALLFAVALVFFHPYFYLALILVFVGLVQAFPLSSRMTENLVCFCLPVIGAIANIHAVCLTYNSTVLFLLARSFAIHGRVHPRHAVVYLLMLASWPFHYDPAQSALYAGAILHGIVNPISFYLFTRKSLVLRLGIFAVPGFWLVANLLVYDQRFVAFWDLEILSLYLFWLLGYDKELVVKRLMLASLPLITFSQIHWDICPRRGAVGRGVGDILKGLIR
jgi:hypothetical protein